MSDILIDNRTLAKQSARYVEVCQVLEQQISNNEGSESTKELLCEANLRIRYILCTLQILKIQLSLKLKVAEKQILVLRNKFTKIISFYQKLFVRQIPVSMREVVERIELLGLEHEEQWLRDLRMLGLALDLFADFTQKSSNYPVVLNYQYQFTAIFRNSILCKNLRPQLGKDNSMCKLRREQLELFHRFADVQVRQQQAFFVRTQSVAGLENAIRITRAMVELGFITDNEFFDTEYYKKQDKAFTKILVDLRDSAKK